MGEGLRPEAEAGPALRQEGQQGGRHRGGAYG